MNKSIEGLHAAIMNLPCMYAAAKLTPAPSDWIEGYVEGHLDARRAAAELVAAQAAPAVPAGESRCSLCSEAEAFTGSCGGGSKNPKALCFALSAPQTAVQGEARTIVAWAYQRNEPHEWDADGNVVKHKPGRVSFVYREPTRPMVNENIAPVLWVRALTLEELMPAAGPELDAAPLPDLTDEQPAYERSYGTENHTQCPPGYEVVAEDVAPSDERGAWTCRACGFRGFWRSGPHCMWTGKANAAPLPAKDERRACHECHELGGCVVGTCSVGAFATEATHTRLPADLASLVRQGALHPRDLNTIRAAFASAAAPLPVGDADRALLRQAAELAASWMTPDELQRLAEALDYYRTGEGAKPELHETSAGFQASNVLRQLAASLREHLSQGGQQ